MLNKGKQYDSYLKILNTESPYDPATPFLEYIPKTTEIRELDRYLYIHVVSSITHNSQKAKATLMPING